MLFNHSYKLKYFKQSQFSTVPFGLTIIMKSRNISLFEETNLYRPL